MVADAIVPRMSDAAAFGGRFEPLENKKQSMLNLTPCHTKNEVNPAQGTATAAPSTLKASTPAQPAPSTVSDAATPSPQTSQVVPAATGTPSDTATAKPTAVLRQSFDVYRRSTKVEVANASQ